MKKIVSLIVLFAAILCLEGTAQQPGDSKPLSNNTTFKGKVELWKEKRAEHHKKVADRRHTREARKKNTYGGVTRKEIHIRKPKKKKGLG